MIGKNWHYVEFAQSEINAKVRFFYQRKKKQICGL